MEPRWLNQQHEQPQTVDYTVSIDRAFCGFAADCGVEPEQLFVEAEKAILTRHHEAVPNRTPENAIQPDVWRLDFGPASVIYAVRGKTAHVLDYLCNSNGLPYEPSQDLLAGQS